MKSFYFILILIFTLAIGCRSRQPIIQSETHTIERVIPRDTTIIVPGSSAQLEALLKELIEGKTFKQSNQNSTVTVRYLPQEKSIQAECECDTLAIKMMLFDKYLTTHQQTKIIRQESKPSWRDKASHGFWISLFIALWALVLIQTIKSLRTIKK